jgi:hypothetical protein
MHRTRSVPQRVEAIDDVKPPKGDNEEAANESGLVRFATK